MEPNTNREIVNKNTGEVTTYKAPQEEILKSDIIVPYVVVAQGLSDSVVQRKAQMGDIIRSTNFEKLGDPDKPIDVIFLNYPKANWIIEKKAEAVKGKEARYEYQSVMERNAGNETLPWYYSADADGNECAETAPGAKEWRRVKQMVVFAILPADVDAFTEEMKKIDTDPDYLPDPSKSVTPVILSFRSSSYKAGKEVATFFAQVKNVKKDIWKYQLKAGCSLTQNDDGSFYVWEVDRSKPKAVNAAHKETVEYWAKIVNSKAVEELIIDVNGEGESYQTAQAPNASHSNGAVEKTVGSAKAEVC